MPDNDIPHVPQSRTVTKKRTRLSVVWIVPIVAAVAGTWVAVTRILGEGPNITIVFRSADGLEAGKTKIEYNGVEVGRLTTIRLSDDHQRVITTAQMAPKTEDFFVADTQFWVVRPRVSGANVTGLGTLISGAYIGMDIGQSHDRKREFVGLESPPVVTFENPGRFFVLKTADLGSLDTGTPLFFRRLQVGQVVSYALDNDGQSFTVKVFVNAPYDQYVNGNTRFWQASGIDVSLTATGLSVQTQSVLSLLIGGVAFETPGAAEVLPAADANTVFPLYANRTEAFRPPVHNPQTYLLTFKDSVRGLAVGAPVEFRGIQIGEVAEVRAQIDVKTFEFVVPVTILLDPLRLGVRLVEGDVPDVENARRKLIDALVARGVRAQLRTGNMLTGALYVAFDTFADAPPATVDWSQKPVELPTMPGQIEAIEASVVSIIKKLDKVPIQGIGDDLRKALVGVDTTLTGARQTLDNAGKVIEPNSPLDQELTNTLHEVSGAARGIRVLTDYLERHPEALIRGKTGEAK